MLLNSFNDLKFDYDDILLQQAETSPISSRSEINIYDKNGYLPLIASPMLDVISKDNFDVFTNNKIYGIYPRTIWNKDYNFNGSGLKFSAHSLDEFKYWFLDNDMKTPTGSILIDVAQGGMQKIVDYLKLSKEKYGDRIQVMVGNIANPNTFKILADAGAYGVRVSIGSGSGCLTSVNTAVGYPVASLISEIYEIKKKYNLKTKIIIDGGITNYSHIIKALVLGADQIMIGGLFTKALESASPCFLDPTKSNETISYLEAEELFKQGIPIYKKFRGMSTKSVQRELGNDIIKTSEGVERIVKVEYTLDGWVQNFDHYLKSAMSYCGCSDISEITNIDYNLITANAFKRYNK